MKKSKKKIIITVSIIAVLVVLIAAVVFVYLTTDLFKSNQNLFYKYAAQNGQMFAKYVENPNQERIKNIKSDKYTKKATMTFELVSSETQLANQTVPARNFSIEYIKQANPQEQKDSSEATLKFLNNDLFKVKYAHNGDLYALTSNEIINKYLAFDNNNLKELATKYGIEDVNNIPNKIELKDYTKLFSIDENEMKYILETYMNVVNNQIPKDKYYAKKEITISTKENQIQANGYGVKLNAEEVKNLLVAILEQLKQDDRTLNVLREKIELVDSQTQITLTSLKSNIPELIAKIQNYNGFQGVKIEIYEKEGKLVKTIVEQDDGSGFNIDYEENDKAIRMVYTKQFSYTNQTNMGNDDFIFENETPTSQTMPEINFTIKTLEMAKQKETNQLNNIIIATFELGDKTYRASLQNKAIQDMQTNSVNNDATIIISDSDTTYFTIKSNSVIIPSNDVVVDEVTSENSAIINNFTPEYTQKLVQAITKRLQQLYIQKLQIINTVQQENN